VREESLDLGIPWQLGGIRDSNIAVLRLVDISNTRMDFSDLQ